MDLDFVGLILQAVMHRIINDMTNAEKERLIAGLNALAARNDYPSVTHFLKNNPAQPDRVGYGPGPDRWYDRAVPYCRTIGTKYCAVGSVSAEYGSSITTHARTVSYHNAAHAIVPYSTEYGTSAGYRSLVLMANCRYSPLIGHETVLRYLPADATGKRRSKRSAQVRRQELQTLSNELGLETVVGVFQDDKYDDFKF